MPRIKVSDKALAHLSRGLYRSPASALKELVSNAWDANAQTVTISTNYPNFLQVSCTDDGDGFGRREFDALMRGGIGNSTKGTKAKPLINNRPVLGRLGIGMLSIAQICGRYTITSHPKIGEAFRARVILYDLLREKLDKEEPAVVTRSKASAPSQSKSILGESEAITGLLETLPFEAPIEEVDIGTFEFVPLNGDDIPFGTSIVADDVHPAFARAFQKSLTLNKFVEPNIDWAKSINAFYKISTIRELGDYWKLLWELSVASPIPYLSADAMPGGAIRTEHKQLCEYDFNLIVDGIALKKPVRLKGNHNGYTVVKFDKQDSKVYGKKLCFDGYLVVQEGLEIKPAELRGILIRIKNVAIGYYDGTLLDYRINEGPRSRWLTGEVFVHDGLENALNIDRDSFNQFHPEFRAVQEYVHDQLQKQLFAEVYKKLELRSQEKATRRASERTGALKNILRTQLDKEVSLRTVQQDQSCEQSPAVVIAESSRKIEVKLPESDAFKIKQANKQLATSILTIFEIAMNERTLDERRKTFTNLLLALLKNW
jgi:Histidine kinase-, DNA gyrase B-, and HSP90-like ATPase